MKVLCIDAEPRDGDCETNLLEENKVYHAVGECMAVGTDGSESLAYLLAEFSPENGFEQDRFIPLSDIDEMELVKQEKSFA